MKKVIAFLLAAAIAVSATACSGEDKSKGESQGSNGARTQITFLGTIKDEISEDFKKELAAYNASQSKYEIVNIPLDNGMQKLTTLYAGGNAPTLFTAVQEAATYKNKLYDFSKFPLIKQARAGTTDLMTTEDGKIYGLPVCEEAFGILYNKNILDKAVGGTFDPSTINTQDKLKELLEKIAATGVDPTRVSGVDWSLGSHMTNLMFAPRSPSIKTNLQFLSDLKASKANLVNDKLYNGWLDTLDLLLQYNTSKKSPLGATYDDDTLAFAQGKNALWFQGDWAMPTLNQDNMSGEVGIMPYPISNNPSDYGNSQISVGPSQFFCLDISQSTKEQQEGALDFLNWFFTSKTGQDYYVNKYGFLSPYKDLTAAPDDYLSKAISKYMDEEKTLNWMNLYYPGDGVSSLGAIMQKYVSGTANREALAKDIQNYWASKQ